MKPGKLPEHNLEKGIFNNLQNNIRLEMGPKIGGDFACSNGIISADGFGENPLIAWDKAMNNFVCSAGECIGARLIIALPDGTKESKLSSFMQIFNKLSQRDGAPILGGHTQVLQGISSPWFSVTLMGKYGQTKKQDTSKTTKKNDGSKSKEQYPIASKKNISKNITSKAVTIQTGTAIIMVGKAGGLGADKLKIESKEKLIEYFGQRVNSLGKVFYKDVESNLKLLLEENLYSDLYSDHSNPYSAHLDPYSIKHVVDVLYSKSNPVSDIYNNDLQIHYMHDVSESGIYGALWEMGKALGKGLEVYNNKILIDQETIEICEVLDLNPYLIDGTGSMLFLSDKEDYVIALLEKNGIKASIIGRITDKKERVVYFGDDEKRVLSP